jgi:hypothetical protein
LSSKKYYISQDLIPTLVKLIIKDKPKNILLSSYDLTYLKHNLRKTDISFDTNTNKLRVKTENKIRNPKDFDLFIDTYIESTLDNDAKLLVGNIIFKEFYTYSEYIEDALTKYVEEPINSQDNLDLLTQGFYEHIIIETQSVKVLESLKTQDNMNITTQQNKNITTFFYSSLFSENILTQNLLHLLGTIYTKTPQNIIGSANKTFSYTRIYK